MELLMSKYRDAYNQRTEGLANAIKQIEELKKENFKLHNIPETLRRELKIQAAKEGRSMNEIILTLIKEYLEGKK